MAITLTGITWKHPRGFDPLAASANAYRKVAPQIEVVWQQREWYLFEETVEQALSSGSGEFDLVMLDHPWIGTFATNHWLVPYSETATWDAVPPSTETYCYNGKTWAVPVDAACHVLAYRSDLLSATAQSLPSDWQDILRLGHQINQPPHRYAFCFSFAGVQGFMCFLSIAASFGFEPYARPHEAVLPRDLAMHVLNLLRSLNNLSHPKSLEWSPPETLDHLGRFDSTVLCPSIFGYVNYAREGSGRKALDFAVPPSGKSGSRPRPIVGGVGLGIPVYSRHQQEALRYANYVMSPKVQLGIFPANEGQPGLRAAWTDPDVQARTGSFYPAMLEAMSTGYVRPRFPGWMQIELASGEAILRYLRGETSATQTIYDLETIRREALENTLA